MALAMALHDAWLKAPPGRLCAWQQARALALREASRMLHGGRSQLDWIAQRVEKVAISMGDNLCLYRRNQTEPGRSRRKFRGTRQAHSMEPHEAQGAVRGAVGNVLTTPVFLQAEPDGAGAEPAEVSRNTQSSLNGTA